jgi:hypothetical protein
MRGPYMFSSTNHARSADELVYGKKPQRIAHHHGDTAGGGSPAKRLEATIEQRESRQKKVGLCLAATRREP